MKMFLLPNHTPLIRLTHSYCPVQIDAESGLELTYDQVLRSVNRLALRLQVGEGLVPGTYVAIALPNCIQLPVALIAVSMCGGVAALVNPVYNTRK